LQVPEGVVVGAAVEVVEVVVDVVVDSQTHLALLPHPCFQQFPTFVASPHDCQPVPGLVGVVTEPETQLQLPSVFLPASAQIATWIKSLQVPEGVVVGTAVEVVEVVVDVVVDSQTHLALHPHPCFQQFPTFVASPHDCHPVPGLVGIVIEPVTQLQLASVFLPARAHRATWKKSLQVPEGVVVGAAEVDEEVVGVSHTHLALQPHPCFQQFPTLVASPHDCQPVPGLVGVVIEPVTHLQAPSVVFPPRAQMAT
jgi:hypothetical protein